jgi:hypothetical protein
MDLFSTGLDENLLPKDGTVFFWPYDANSGCQFYLENLLETIPWKNECHFW